MTVKNAIKLCDYLIERYTKHAKGIRENVKYDSSDNIKDLALTISSTVEDIAKCIGAIKAEIVPKCKHPKKMRDGKPGHRYCMKCNMDMDD